MLFVSLHRCLHVDDALQHVFLSLRWRLQHEFHPEPGQSCVHCDGHLVQSCDMQLRFHRGLHSASVSDAESFAELRDILHTNDHMLWCPPRAYVRVDCTHVPTQVQKRFGCTTAQN